MQTPNPFLGGGMPSIGQPAINNPFSGGQPISHQQYGGGVPGYGQPAMGGPYGYGSQSQQQQQAPHWTPQHGGAPGGLGIYSQTPFCKCNFCAFSTD
jgi:hypothetical protein